MHFSEINIQLFRMINNLGKELTLFNPAMVLIAKYMVVFLALSVIIFWFTRREHNRMMVICGGIAFILAEIMGKIAGAVYSNHQPFAVLSNVNNLMAHEIDNSFPSDHTILFFSFCATFFLFGKNGRFFWVILACLVGVSRIWVGVHYPADIIVGAIIGIFAAFISYHVVPNLEITGKLLAAYDKGEQYILPKRAQKREHY